MTALPRGAPCEHDVNPSPPPGPWPGSGPGRRGAGAGAASLWVRALRPCEAGVGLPGSSHVLEVSRAVRGAVLVHAAAGGRAVPEAVHGHGAGGGATQRPHLAYLALPGATGGCGAARITRVAVAVPGALDGGQRAACRRAWRAVEELRLGRLGRFTLGPIQADGARRWLGPSRRWATASPVALDRHARRGEGEAWEERVASACEWAGLPRPREVVTSRRSLLAVPPSDGFPPLVRKSDGGSIRHTHALLIFDEPVVGPVLLGAGRFRGYGLCGVLPERG